MTQPDPFTLKMQRALAPHAAEVQLADERAAARKDYTQRGWTASSFFGDGARICAAWAKSHREEAAKITHAYKGHVIYCSHRSPAAALCGFWHKHE